MTMHATCNVIFTGTLIMALISKTLCSEMTLGSCADNAIPCVLSQRETQQVCTGESVYSNITLKVPPYVGPDAVTISVQGHQFSKGTSVSGQFHFGDKQLNRWRNKISFEGNTMMYEVWNTNVEPKDEFEYVLEMNIDEKRFITPPFTWFDVDGRCTSTPIKPPSIEDIFMQIKAQLKNIMERLESKDAMAEVQRRSALQSDLKNTADDITNTIQGSTESRCKSLRTIGIVNITVSSLLHLIATIMIMFIIWFMFANQRSSERRSTSSSDMEINESGNTQERAGSLLSVDETAESDNL